MHFNKLNRFNRNTNLGLSQTQVLSPSRKNEKLMDRDMDITKPIFENFMNSLQNSMKATISKNRQAKECLRKTEKLSKSMYKTLNDNKYNRSTMHDGMIIKLLGSSATDKLGPGSYQCCEHSLERKSHNIMFIESEKKRSMSKSKSKSNLK